MYLNLSTSAEGRGQGSRWYVVRTQPGRERLAVQHLRNQAFETFLPLRQRIGKTGKALLTAFFPGYVFVRLDLALHRWRSINGTVGVINILSLDQRGAGLPTAVPGGIVETLSALSEEHGVVGFDEDLQIGSGARIVGGPFDNIQGLIEAKDSARRVILLVEIMSKATRVQVRRDMLVAA